MKQYRFISILVVLAMILAACAPATPAATTAPAAPTTAPQVQPTTAPAAPATGADPFGKQGKVPAPKIGYVLHGLNNFTAVIKQGAEDAGKALGVDVEVTGPAQFISTDAISMFEGLIQKKKDGLVTVPQPGDVWVAPIKEATDAGIPVMTANVTAPGSTASAWFGQDEYNSGVILGQELRKIMEAAGTKSGKVVVGSCVPGVDVLVARYNGFKEGMQGSGFTISEVNDVTPENTANYSAWENLAGANPDMVAAVGLCSLDIPNLAQIKTRTNAKWTIGGYDLNVETLDAIKAGTAAITVGQNPYLQGYLPVLALKEYFVDGKPLVEGWVNVGTEVVTKANVDELYQREKDPATATQWYADWIAKNFSDLSKVAGPMPSANPAPAAPAATTAPAAAADQFGKQGKVPAPKIGYVLHGLNNFTAVIKQGAEDAGKALGVDVEVTGPAQFISTDAISMFEGLIQKKKDGLVTVPQPGDVWVAPIKEATDAGIPVMTANVTAPGSTASAWFGQDEYNSGVILGQELRKIMEAAGTKSGKVVVGSCVPGVDVLVARYNGFKEGMQGSGFTISEVNDVTPENTANYSAWENLAGANPDMVAAVGLCSLDIPNLAQIKTRTNAKWTIGGYDLNVETLDAIKAGTAAITVGQNPYLQGYLPVLALKEYFVDGKPLVEGWVNVGTEVVTKANVDELYQREKDPATATQWYADWIAKNFSDLSKVAGPMPTK